MLQMVRTGRFQAALGVLVCFDTFFRGHDLFNMRKGDLSVAGDVFAISTGRRPRGEPSRTGMDQGVVLDRALLGQLLVGRQQHIHDGDLIWTIDPGALPQTVDGGEGGGWSGLAGPRSQRATLRAGPSSAHEREKSGAHPPARALDFVGLGAALPPRPIS